MPTPRVPRALRLVNLIAGLLFLAGALVYARAWVGMEALRSYQADPAAPPFEGLRRFGEMWMLSRIGLGLVIAAVAVAVGAALAAIVHRRRASASGPDRE